MAAPFLAAADSWQWLSPSPTGNHINSFAYGAGKFVGVGTGGEIVISTDGSTWTTSESGIVDSFSRVVYDGNRFVALSYANILFSSDGIAWTKQNTPANLLDVAAGDNHLLVGVGDSGFFTSTDGSHWTSTASSSPVSRILFANGVFVAIGNDGAAVSSTDGLNWTTTPVLGSGGSRFFVAGNGRFLLSNGSKTYLSTNGTVWREVTAQVISEGQSVTVPRLDQAAAGGSWGFANGYFYVLQSRYTVDAYHVYRSGDGETWEKASSFGNADLSTLASGGGVMVGSEVPILYSGPNAASYTIHSSSDGETWTTRSTNPVNSVTSLVYGLGRFFSGGKVSSDALTWVANPFEPTHAAGDLVFRITSQFPGSGSPSTFITPGAVTTVVASADGLTGLPIDVKMATPRSVAFGAGRYVFVGDGGNVSNSSDGLTWTTGASGTTNDLQAVVFAFNRFVAVGNNGTLLTSPDGLGWTAQNTATSLNFISVAAGTDRIVVGTTGSSTPVPALTLSGNLTVQVATAVRSDNLIWFDGEFTSVEFHVNTIGNTSAGVSKSTDGVTWTEVPLHAPWSGSGHTRIASGNNIALLSLPAGVAWTLDPLFTATFQKRISGAAAPVIASAPAAAAVQRGETAIFSVGVTGSGPLSYQWKYNGTAIPGATSQVLSRPLANDADAGNYTVTVTNSSGSTTSTAATLSVDAAVPLTITKQPVGGTLYEFQSFYLTVEVAGSGPVTYQWRKNGTPVSGATSATYEIYAASYSMDNYTGTYDVVVTAPTSTITSQTVVVSRSGPVVTVSKSGSTGLGNTLVATAMATGKGPFTYVWGKAGGFTLVGATDASVLLPNVTSDDTSSYSVKVTDADGLTTQAFFTVAGSGSTPVSSQTTATAGQKLTLRTPISAPLNFTFQWRFKNTPIAGATDWSYTTPAIDAATAGEYSVVVTTAGSDTTYTTTIALGSAPAAPAFVAQTASRTVSTGLATTFSVSAGGAAVSSYQWQVSTDNGSTWTNISEGSPYSGTATATLAVTASTAMNGYQYRCVAFNAGGTATSAAATLLINNTPLLLRPVAIARDNSGNLFVADVSANVIRLITPTGAVSVFAGSEGNAGSADGTGTAARFNQPGGLAFDTAGNLYVADTGNGTIRKITAGGTVSTLAGDTVARGNVDGAGSAARFNHPAGLAVDLSGNVFVADTFTHTVRKITSGGAVTTLAGTNGASGSADGSGAAARFNGPAGVSVDGNGTVYVADTGNSTIRKITAGGVVTTLAGLPGVGGSNDGTGSTALFSLPSGIAVDTNGTVYVADTGNALIRRVTPAGVVTLLAGVPGISGLSDGVGLDALFDQPQGLTLDQSGSLFVADTGNAAVRKITNATVTTAALTAAAAPAPVTNTPTPTVNSPGTSLPATNSSSGGGGGAMNPWFVGSIGLLLALYRRHRKPVESPIREHR